MLKHVQASSFSNLFSIFQKSHHQSLYAKFTHLARFDCNTKRYRDDVSKISEILTLIVFFWVGSALHVSEIHIQYWVFLSGSGVPPNFVFCLISVRLALIWTSIILITNIRQVVSVSGRVSAESNNAEKCWLNSRNRSDDTLREPYP